MVTETARNWYRPVRRTGDLSRAEFETRHAELRQEITQIEQELKQEVAKLEGKIDALATSVGASIASNKVAFWRLVATNLLTLFVGIGGGIAIDIIIRR